MPRRSRRLEFVGWEFEGGFPNPRRARYWASDTAAYFNLGSVMPDGQGSHHSRAEAINNNAYPKVVGWNASNNHALLWEAQAGPPAWVVSDLNTLIPECWDVEIQLRQAHDINDSGWIVAYGDGDLITSGIQPHAFVLIPLECAIADFDESGDVGFTDLLALMGAWGPCEDCAEDLNGDDDVGFTDLLTLFAKWGPCPTCGSAVYPLPFEEVLDDAGLDEADWAVFEDCFINGDDEETKNCACWFAHYLEGCIPSCQTMPNCEGSDPLENH